jgi:hypothetical protein
MAWIRFTAPFDFKATPAVTIAYKPGVYQVTSACATLAVAAGKAVRLKKTRKDEEPWQESEPERAPLIGA